MARSSVMGRLLQNTPVPQAVSFVLIEMTDLQYIFLMQELWDILFLELKQTTHRVQVLKHLLLRQLSLVLKHQLLLRLSLVSNLLRDYLLLWLCHRKFRHLILQWNLLRHPSKERPLQLNLVDAGLVFRETRKLPSRS